MGNVLTEYIHDKAAEVADLMKERLGVRGNDLGAKLRHTGRMMPKRIKRDAAYLAEACTMAENPKLSRMIDHDRINAAHLACMTFLQEVDVADRRKGVVLGILASLVLVLIVVTVMVLSVLVWRGFL